MIISVVLPAYQEGENLKTILPKIKAAVEKLAVEYEVLVVDTIAPTDDTAEVCAAHGVVYLPRLHGNTYGDAIRTGFAASKGDYVVIMDADGSHNPEDILKFYQKIEPSYDLIIGSRYTGGGGTHNGFVLKFMSWMVNVAYRVIFGLKVKDVSDSFRMYRGAQVRALSLECDNFDIVEEILIKLVLSKKDYRIYEEPIYFNKRQHGESKRNLLKFVASYAVTIIKLLRIKQKAKRS